MKKGYSHFTYNMRNENYMCNCRDQLFDIQLEKTVISHTTRKKDITQKKKNIKITHLTVEYDHITCNRRERPLDIHVQQEKTVITQYKENTVITHITGDYSHYTYIVLIE